MRHSSASWAWSRSEASVLLIIDDRSLFKYEQWWMGNSLSGLHAHAIRPFYLHLSWRCIATQGGAVSQFLYLFSSFWVDEKQRTQFFRFCFCKTSAETSFKELPMTISVPVVLEALFLWLQAFVLLGLMSFTRQAFVFTGCLTQTQ